MTDLMELRNDGTTLYDRLVLSICLFYWRLEAGNIPSGHDISDLKVVFLMVSRGYENLTDDLQEFEAYLRYMNDDEVNKALNFDDDDPDISLWDIYLIQEDLSAQDRIDLEHAAAQAMFAVYRWGVQPPDRMLDKYGLDELGPKHHDSARKFEEIQAEFMEYIDLLWDETLDPLTFGSETRNNTTASNIGLWAMAAMIRSGFPSAVGASVLFFGADGVPHQGTAAGSIKKYLSSSGVPPTEPPSNSTDIPDPPTLEAQFRQIHDATFELAEEYGFFEEPVNLALDNVLIDRFGDPVSATIKARVNPKNDRNNSWMFTILTIVDNNARFAIGARLIPRLTYYPAAAKDLIDIAANRVNINEIYVDAGSVSGDLISAVRDGAGTEGIIKAPRRDHDVKKLIRATPGDRIGFMRRVPWNMGDVPDPTVIAIPYKSSYSGQLKRPIEFPRSYLKEHIDDDANSIEPDPNKSITQSDIEDGTNQNTPIHFQNLDTDLDSLPKVGNASSHVPFITYRNLEERNPIAIYFHYKNRWTTEQSNNEIKNGFRAPIQSSSPRVQIFGINLAVLFYNWHVLINRTHAPHSGDRLDIYRKILLGAIAKTAFSN